MILDVFLDSWLETGVVFVGQGRPLNILQKNETRHSSGKPALVSRLTFCLHCWMCVCVYADLVKAYKKVLKERKGLEDIVKKTSPFDSLADPEGILAHYTNLNSSIQVLPPPLL